MKINPGAKALLIYIALILFIPISFNWFKYIGDFYQRNFSNYVSANNLTFKLSSDLTAELVANDDYYKLDKVEVPNALCFEEKTYTVTKIGDEAFYQCRNLKEITIPSTITYIGKKAFMYCWSLGKIKTSLNGHDVYDDNIFCSNIKTIGDFAFDDCYKLTSLVIPSSINKIGDYAFNYCYNLSIKINKPKEKIKIGLSTFDKCKSVTFTRE